jgi:hypothetical protein
MLKPEPSEPVVKVSELSAWLDRNHEEIGLTQAAEDMKRLIAAARKAETGGATMPEKPRNFGSKQDSVDEGPSGVRLNEATPATPPAGTDALAKVIDKETCYGCRMGYPKICLNDEPAHEYPRDSATPNRPNRKPCKALSYRLMPIIQPLLVQAVAEAECRLREEICLEIDSLIYDPTLPCPELHVSKPLGQAVDRLRHTDAAHEERIRTDLVKRIRDYPLTVSWGHVPAEIAGKIADWLESAAPELRQEEKRG